MPDAIAITIGTPFGTFTITCHIESSAGIAEEGTTGLASVVTASLFLLALFLPRLPL